jgi:hypothetical protein
VALLACRRMPSLPGFVLTVQSYDTPGALLYTSMCAMPRPLLLIRIQ